MSGLVLGAKPSSAGELDTHPLIREHFGRMLKRGSPNAFRAGHGRLYDHYSTVAPAAPETLRDNQPLFLAMKHGCRAGRRQEACSEVYRERIDRGSFGISRLGTFGSALAAVGGLFDQLWNRPSTELAPDNQAWLLNEVGLYLRALGRLEDAAPPMEAALRLSIEQREWEHAAIDASNLSQLTLALGKVNHSLEWAYKSVEFADRSKNDLHRLTKRSTLADAFHAAGRFKEAFTAFREAEGEGLRVDPAMTPMKLHSLRGYHYCDFLLTQAAPLDGSGTEELRLKRASPEALELCQEVLERAIHALNRTATAPNPPLLSLAVAHLSLGRAKLGLAIGAGRSLGEAKAETDEAVLGLRRAGDEHHLPRGLLARATLHRFNEDEPAAETDLAEALEIAERGSMRLHECDAHLEWGRLRYSVEDREGARAHLEVARKIVEETGYGRREREVRELSEALGVVDE